MLRSVGFQELLENVGEPPYMPQINTIEALVSPLFVPRIHSIVCSMSCNSTIVTFAKPIPSIYESFSFGGANKTCLSRSLSTDSKKFLGTSHPAC